MRHQQRHPVPLLATVLATALALGLAACGTGAVDDGGVVSLADPSASPGASAAPSAPIDPEEAMLAFTDCMREHGVDIQVSFIGSDEAGKGGVHVSGPVAGAEPQPGGTAVDPEKIAEAEKACAHLRPALGPMGDPAATMDPAMADAMLGFAQCMRDHGIDFPDPVFEGGGVSIAIGGPDGEGGIDPMSEAFQAAQEACGKAMPEGGPFVVGGTSSETRP
jgi:hypothetical protein